MVPSEIIRERTREGPIFMILWKWHCIIRSLATIIPMENKIGADGDFIPANLSASLEQ
jgi:hypothetical protein